MTLGSGNCHEQFSEFLLGISINFIGLIEFCDFRTSDLYSRNPGSISWVFLNLSLMITEW